MPVRSKRSRQTAGEQEGSTNAIFLSLPSVKPVASGAHESQPEEEVNPSVGYSEDRARSPTSSLRP